MGPFYLFVLFFPTMMLDVKKISFNYPNKNILNQCSCSLPIGGIGALIGTSGSGKSTLFNIISGLLMPQEGEVTFNEKPLNKKSGLISYMLQTDFLLPWRSLLDNLLLIPEIKSLPKKEWIGPAKALLDEVGLYEYCSYFPHQLSGGMRKRAALAAALLMNPPLLLLDEPFSSIDSFRKKELYKLILKLKHKRNLTIFFVSHQLEDVSAIATHSFLLHNGELFEGRDAASLEKLLEDKMRMGAAK